MSSNDAVLRVWPRPQQIKVSGRSLSISRSLSVVTAGKAAWLKKAAQQAAQVLNRAAGKKIAGSGRGKVKLTITDMDALPARSGLKPVRKAEGYALKVTPSGIILAGFDAAGVFYGAQTLAQLLEKGKSIKLPGAAVRDWPKFDMRGVHMYLPPRKHLDFFWRWLDYQASIKHNTLVLELGGGMEFKRHPKINRAWKKFAREAEAYELKKDKDHKNRRHPPHPTLTKGAQALQSSRYFSKDSTHTELAGGDWLTQKEIRKIVAECNKRHIRIIPEVQSLSHCYWLCLAYPEIAERPASEEPWPDTYCPSNPRSYELLFDCMDEVIDMFKPKIMHIGHDEAYTFRICPKCRKRTGGDILAGDITKIRNFLATRGVRPMMWGDKIMNSTVTRKMETIDGVVTKKMRYGGIYKSRTDPVTGKKWIQPATWQARSRIPKDVIICDWYWAVDPKSEKYFDKYGFDMAFGNFAPRGLKDKEWEKRGSAPNVIGATHSSWCEVSPHAFGHNGIIYESIGTCDLVWNGKQMKKEHMQARVASRMPAIVDHLTGEPRWLTTGKGGKARDVNISAAAGSLPASLKGKVKTGKRLSVVTDACSFNMLADGKGRLDRAVVLDKTCSKSSPIGVDRKAKKLVFLHGTTMEDIFWAPTYGMYHRGPAYPLEYTIRYADGKSARVKVEFSNDIGQVNGPWPGTVQRYYYQGYAYRGVHADIGGKHRLYAQEWTNPRPKAAIKSITARLGPDAMDEGEVIVAAVSTVS